MKTIYTLLPIYDSTAKQDYNRTGAIIPIYTPRHRLPAWQYNVGATVVGAVTQIDLINAAGTTTNITSYFPTLSDDYVLSTDTYYKYDGDTLNYLLNPGAFYLKITHANGYIYYSEWFVVTDIYPKLTTNWTNGVGIYEYETFAASGTKISSAIETGTEGACYSDDFTLGDTENILIVFYLTINSGQAPDLYLIKNPSTIIDNVGGCTAGLNAVTLTGAGAGTYHLQFNNTAAANWSVTEVYAIRVYSPNFIKIAFYDTHDLGDIVYQNGFAQTLYLQTRLNAPQHEPTEIGDEKDGIFIAEKIITKFKFRIITYVGPVQYRSLIRLPQHDHITITDEVGFTYSPRVGNIKVNPINQLYFDTGALEITFNDNSEWVWTSEKNNLT